MYIRTIKILLSSALAVWGIAAGIGNLVMYQAGIDTVATILMLEGQQSIRAIHSPIMHHLAYSFIYLGKFITGFLCAWGSFDLWKARSESIEIFDTAKSRTILGCGVALFMLFFGFIALAGAVFRPAFGPPSPLTLAYHQYTMFYMAGIGLISLYISAREHQ